MDSCKVKKNMKKILAFTLAEVLISLTIIGVIAALTVPVIMNNSQQKANAIAYRRIITVLNETVERSVAETRFLPQPRCFYWDKNPYGAAHCVKWDDSGNCTQYKLANGQPWPDDYNGGFTQCGDLLAFMKKNLLVQKECASGYSDGCLPEYDGNDTNYKDSHPDAEDVDVNKATSGCGNFRKANIKTRPAFVLDDGTIIFVYSSAQLMAVDVNGKKGPNKWGHDLWPITLKGNYTTIPQYAPGGCDIVQKGGISASTAYNMFK